MQPTDILGHKFHADAHVRISREDYAANAAGLLASVEKTWGVSFDSLDDMFERAGWEIGKEEDAVTLSEGEGNMFSGRWRDEEQVAFLRELAAAGFEGSVQVHSQDDDLQVDYTLTGGTLNAAALTPKKAADTNPREIFGHKVDAGGSLTITRKALNASSDVLLAALERMQESEASSLEQALEAAGWMLFVNREIFESVPLGRAPGRPFPNPRPPCDADVIELSPGPFGMFSGRWHEYDAEHLKELAKVGFEGGITITGEEGLEVKYTLADGSVTAEAYVTEFLDEDEDDEDFVKEDESPPSP